MSRPRLVGPGVLSFLAACVILPIAAAALRGGHEPRCEIDGVALAEAPVVRVIEDSGVERDFCCVRCASRWVDTTRTKPDQVLVTDAVASAMIDARYAWFVRSSVVAQAATQDHVHAFATEAAAREHAKNYRGRVLTGDARPFGAAH